MKNTLMASLLLLIGFTAAADQFKTVTVKKDLKNYTYQARYPQLLRNSVPAFRAINKGIKTELSGCDTSLPNESGWDFNATATIVALNSNYVGMQISYDAYCGGAHPDATVYYLTFDSKTGRKMDLGVEFGFPSMDGDWDTDQYEAAQKRIAQFLLSRIPGDMHEECYDGNASAEEQLSNMMIMSPQAAGLAKDKTVVLGTSPAHVAQACQFHVRAGYNEIKHLLVPNSRLHDWLR